MLNFRRISLLALLCALCLSCCQCQTYELAEGERHIQALEDHLDAENFTYYRLQREGLLKLVLTSFEGDVDIFASSEVQHPSFYNYELKSESCGLDIVTVPVDMPRPVYIGLYGHPIKPHSRFSLSIISVPIPKSVSYEDLVTQYERYFYDDISNADSPDERERIRMSSPESDTSDHYVKDDMPVWWKIFLGILEFGIEVIL